MAKRRAATQIIRSIPIQTRPMAPIIKVSAPRAIATKKPKHRRRSACGAVGSLTFKNMLGIGLGGAAFGYIEKTFPTMPSLPLVGRSGTIALAAYFLSKRGGMGGGIVRDIAIAGAAISGYQLGKTGTISGDVMGDEGIDGLAAEV